MSTSEVTPSLCYGQQMGSRDEKGRKSRGTLPLIKGQQCLFNSAKYFDQSISPVLLLYSSMTELVVQY